MHRIIVKPGQLPLDEDALKIERFSHVGLGRFIAQVMGLETVADGMEVTQTSPASMQVKVSAGSLCVLGQVDANAYGTLASDTRPIMRLGELADDALITLTAPATFGHAINYLIQATFSEADDTPVVRPYYNESNPAEPFSGPENSGVTDYTVRRAACVVSSKAGSSATAGTQSTATADPGYVPLAVVTVAFGATTITSVNIVAHALAPYLLAKLPQIPSKVQSGTWIYAADAGSANALSIVLTPIPAVPPRLILVKAAATNTAATTISVNGTTYPLVREDGTALVGNQILANQMLALLYDGGSYQLLNPSTSIPLAPIFPEILATSNIFTFTSSTGSVSINSGLAWVWRGLRGFNTAHFSSIERTFSTQASKTYHLRWYAPGTSQAPQATYPRGRFMLQDLADGGYNPSANTDSSTSFDSTYDNMLIARVVTNGSNVPTITALKNLAVLTGQLSKSTFHVSTATWNGLATASATLNWARSPRVQWQYANAEYTTNFDAINTMYTALTRYSAIAALYGYSWDVSTPSYVLYTSGPFTLDLSC